MAQTGVRWQCPRGLIDQPLVLIRVSGFHIVDKRHQRPQRVVVVGRAESGHAGHAHAVLDDPEGFRRSAVGNDVGKVRRGWVQAFGDHRTGYTGRGVTALSHFHEALGAR